MKSDKKNIDTDLIVRLKQGDVPAFEELYWKYNARLYNFTYSIIHDQTLAKDITQVCFLKIWEKREGIDPENGFVAYLHTIAKHLVYKNTEKRLIEANFLEAAKKQLNEYDNSTQEAIDITFIQEHIDKLIERLPESRRNIFVMSHVKGMINKEIADQLSISEKTVETQIYRSILFLRENLKEYLLLIGLFFLAKII